MSSAPADGSEPSHPRSAEDDLVRAFEPLVQARTRRFARRPDLADDLAQEGRLGVLRAVRSLGPPSVARAVATQDAEAWRVRAYVERSVRNALVDAVRRDAPTPDSAALPEVAEDCRDQVETALDVRRALHTLTPKQAQTAHAFADGLSLRGAAERLGVSLAALRERRDGTFASLRAHLHDYA